MSNEWGESRCKGELIVFPALISLFGRIGLIYALQRIASETNDHTRPACLCDTRIEYFAPPVTNYGRRLVAVVQVSPALVLPGHNINYLSMTFAAAHVNHMTL